MRNPPGFRKFDLWSRTKDIFPLRRTASNRSNGCGASRCPESSKSAKRASWSTGKRETRGSGRSSAVRIIPLEISCCRAISHAGGSLNSTRWPQSRWGTKGQWITSLARLLAKQGNRDEARALLAAIYNQFTEGFDTAEKDAKAMLDELGV